MEESEERVSDNNKNKFLRQGNVSLILESYNDIFSDFDPRPFSERALSDDFLFECRKAAREPKEFDLRLLIAKEKRSMTAELKIKKRLKEHFQKHLKEKEQDIKITRLRGFLWFLFGAILILITTIFVVGRAGLLFNFLTVALEPAGWFIAWSGLDNLLIGSREKQSEYEFYKKMAHAEIEFFSY